jgi:hypothetical protein
MTEERLPVSYLRKLSKAAFRCFTHLRGVALPLLPGTEVRPIHDLVVIVVGRGPVLLNSSGIFSHSVYVYTRVQ